MSLRDRKRRFDRAQVKTRTEKTKPFYGYIQCSVVCLISKLQDIIAFIL